MPTLHTDRDYHAAVGWLNRSIKVPAGSRVIPASNLPAPQCDEVFWLDEAPSWWDREDVGWMEVYGIMIPREYVRENG